MARINVHCFSQALSMCTSFDVVIPDAREGTKPFALLYLLHGLSDDHTIWLRRTSIERYADRYGIAVVMPAAGRSYYTDMAAGLRYWTYISEELPTLVDRYFSFRSPRERTFVAGLSMGGYGALKLAFTFPERFSAAGSFSGAVDPASLIEEIDSDDDPASEARMREFTWVFGDPPIVSGTDRDLFYLAGDLGSRAPENGVPRIYLSCGSEDSLITHNRRFASHLDRLGIEAEYREEPGTHEWGFWDRHVELFLSWLSKPGSIHRG